ENQAREIDFLRGRMEEILAFHTGQPRERVADDTDRDYILGAQGAVEYGLVDEILQPRRLKMVPPLPASPERALAAGADGAPAEGPGGPPPPPRRRPWRRPGPRQLPPPPRRHECRRGGSPSTPPRRCRAAETLRSPVVSTGYRILVMLHLLCVIGGFGAVAY